MDSKYSNILKILTKSIDEQVGGDVIRNIPKIAKECQIIGLHLEKYLKLIKDPSLAPGDVINIISKVGCNKVSFSHNEATQIYRALTLEPLKNLTKQTGGAAAYTGFAARSPIDLIRHTFRKDEGEITGTRGGDKPVGTTPIEATRRRIGRGSSDDTKDPPKLPVSPLLAPPSPLSPGSISPDGSLVSSELPLPILILVASIGVDPEGSSLLRVPIISPPSFLNVCRIRSIGDLAANPACAAAPPVCLVKFFKGSKVRALYICVASL